MPFAISLRPIVFAAFALIAPAVANAQDETRPPSVTVVSVATTEMQGRVPISGTLVPREEVLIYPQVSGYTIDEMLVEIGDEVKKGDVLARLNSRTLSAQLAQAEAERARAMAAVGQAQSQISSAQASLTQAQTALARAEQLRSSGTGTQANLEQAVAAEQTARATLASVTDGLAVAMAQQQQAQAQVDIALLNLDHATIAAPVDGLIAARAGKLGAIATAGGDPIFRLISEGTIEVEAEVVETAMSDLAMGNEVLLEIAGVGPVGGTIRRISPVVDPVTRLGLVRITTEANPNLRPGLFASGWIVTVRRASLAVPATAVLSGPEGDAVLTVTDNVIVRKPVTTGLIWQDRIEVLEGLQEGDTVVARAGAFFAAGDLITPVAAEEAAE